MGAMIGMIWLFPVLWYFFESENMWWVMSGIFIASTLIHLAKLDWVIDKIDIEKDMKGNEVFWLYDYGNHCDCDKGGK